MNRSVVVGLLSLFAALAVQSPALAAAPVNDNFANATNLGAITRDAPAAISGTTVEATNESNVKNECCGFGGTNIQNTVWFRWTSSKTANYEFEVCGAAFNTSVFVYKDGAPADLEEVARNDDAAGCGPSSTASRVQFIGTAGQTYDIQLGSPYDKPTTGNYSGSLKLVSPANDFFADATTLTGTSISISGTTVGASNESTAKNECCGVLGTSISNTDWYTWTAPKTGNYEFEICGADFNTSVFVYKYAAAAKDLEEVARNDDAAGCGASGTTSRIQFIATKDQAYAIQVGSPYDKPATGTFSGSFKLVSPPNDFFADATPLTGTSATFTGTTVGASNEANARNECCGVLGTNISNTVWYSWTAPSAGVFAFDTCGADFDTMVYVYKAAATPQSLDEVFNNDDTAGCGPNGKASRVAFTATAGQAYVFQVGSPPDKPATGRIAGALKPPTARYTDATTSKGSSDALATYGLRAPARCVRPDSTFVTTLSVKRKKRKGNVFVKVTRVDFSIDGSNVRTDKKAPFRQTMVVKATAKRGSTVTLRARAFIKVKRGKAPKKSITVKLKICA